MKNWKTTIGGLMVSAGLAMQNSDDQIIRTVGGIFIVVGPIILGVSAKDKNVTGVGDDARSL